MFRRTVRSIRRTIRDCCHRRSCARAQPVACKTQLGISTIIRASTRALHVERPGQKRGGVTPNDAFRITKNYSDNIAARSRCARDEAMPGRVGVAGFHSVAKREALQDLVGVLELAR